MDIIHLLFEITSFLDRGGLVLYAITAAAFLLWFLIFERLLFIYLRTGRDMRILSDIWVKIVIAKTLNKFVTL